MKQELEEALDDIDPATFLAVKQELLEADDDGNAMMYTYAYVRRYVCACAVAVAAMLPLPLQLPLG